MSHSAIITFDICVNAEKNILNNLENELNKISSLNTRETFKEQIKQLNCAIKEAYKNLENISGKYEVESDLMQELKQKYQIQIDSIMKRIEILNSQLNFFDEFANMLFTSSEEIKNIIINNGIMAEIAIANLNQKAQEINPTSLLFEIEQIRNKKILDQILIKNKQSIIKKIEILNLPTEFKISLIQDIEKYNTPQEINDFMSYYKAFEIDFVRTKNLIFLTLDGLKLLGFQIIRQSYDIIKSNFKTLYKIKLEVKNKQNKQISMIFDTNGTLEYQMGNYEGHMCDIDANKLMEFLSEKGYKTVNSKITRNISNAKPLFMRVKNDIEEGTK